jgi:hypothetical protein
VQNSLQAEASEICIEVLEHPSENMLQISISDNGKGMTSEQLNEVLNPFYTTKNKKTGLGIPLLKQHAEMTGGNLSIEKGIDKGTKVIASFCYNHIDRQPMGDIAGTLAGIIRANPDIHIVYWHGFNNKAFVFDTNEFIAELDGIPISSPQVINFIIEFIRDNINELYAT